VPGYSSDTFYVVDPVLKREKHRFRVDERTNTLRRSVGIVCLDAEEDQVNGTDLARVVGGVHWQRERSGKS
jgi:hypothetical protein